MDGWNVESLCVLPSKIVASLCTAQKSDHPLQYILYMHLSLIVVKVMWFPFMSDGIGHLCKVLCRPRPNRWQRVWVFCGFTYAAARRQGNVEDADVYLRVVAVISPVVCNVTRPMGYGGSTDMPFIVDRLDARRGRAGRLRNRG
jgi:hypothetical protein